MRNRCTLMPVTPTMSARAQPVEVDRLDVLVDQGDGVLGRREGGQQRQAGDRQVGPLAEERQGVLQAPVRDLEPRIDQDDVGHEVPEFPGAVWASVPHVLAMGLPVS